MALSHVILRRTELGHATMKTRVLRGLGAASLTPAPLLMTLAQPVCAVSLSDVFERAAPSVDVVRTTARDIADEGQQRTLSISRFGSGILISPEGEVLIREGQLRELSMIVP